MLPSPNHLSNPAGKRWFSYQQTSDNLISAYQGEEPFSSFLKKYFAAHKKHGSTDRKNIASLCYAYFRTRSALDHFSPEQRWQLVIFLAGQPSAAPFFLPAAWQNHFHEPIHAKLLLLKEWMPSFQPQLIFPLREHLSAGIDSYSFAISHLIQPNLFLRIRPGHRASVENKLQAAGIAFQQLGGDAIAVANHTPVNQLLELDREVVVQDLSSQYIGNFFQFIQWKGDGPRLVWDCCAASGGKSLLVLDRIKNVALTVSDIRPSVLANLNKRLMKAGWKKYSKLEVDLTGAIPRLPQQQLIICDAPCSGSGTWGRTPEYIRFFTEDRIRFFTERQRAILTHIYPLLRESGYLLYITCSVFREENEEMVAWLLGETKLELVSQQIFPGYEWQADTMFGALLRKV